MSHSGSNSFFKLLKGFIFSFRLQSSAGDFKDFSVELQSRERNETYANNFVRSSLSSPAPIPCIVQPYRPYTMTGSPDSRPSLPALSIPSNPKDVEDEILLKNLDSLGLKTDKVKLGLKSGSAYYLSRFVPSGTYSVTYQDAWFSSESYAVAQLDRYIR
jgi:hypothetical protein